MSALLRKELFVLLSPGRVDVAIAEQKVTRLGLKHEIKDRTSIAAVAGGSEAQKGEEQPWSGGLRALDAALPTYRNIGRRLSATVFLSNHFARYVLVPRSDVLVEDEERLAFSQQCLRETYGDAAEMWEPRLSPDRDGPFEVASGVDRRLLEDLRKVFDRNGVSLVSIQPRLMAVFNGFRNVLEKRSAWLALIEPGILCLELLHRGKWVRSRSVRIGPDWQADLPMILEREAYLTSASEQTREVLVFAPGGDANLSVPVDNDRWEIQPLIPGTESGRGIQADVSVLL